MADPVIRVEHLSKTYRVTHKGPRHDTFTDLFTDLIRNPFRKRAERTQQDETFWALRDLSFGVQPGEVVGIIGRNGAGKSTLLKVLSRITAPTEGRVTIRGRVASLLEVGTGFHPELTGRENVQMNGSILGMTRAEINRKFDEIVDFAGVDRFLDTPLKRYSSGMQVRLAFAVAAHLDPEILIVDEVLAVGDAAFQKKCLGKIGEVAGGGRTVLFVSHNMSALGALCRRALWLDAGCCVGDGPADEVIANYLSTAFAQQTERSWGTPADAPGNEQVRLRRASVRADVGDQGITVRTPITFDFEYWVQCPDLRLHVTLHLLDEQGATVLSSASIFERDWHGKAFPAGTYRSACHLPGDLLNDGQYTLKVLFVRDVGTVLCILEDVLTFAVHDDPSLRGDWYGRWPGVVRPNLPWTTTRLDPPESPSGSS